MMIYRLPREFSLLSAAVLWMVVAETAIAQSAAIEATAPTSDSIGVAGLNNGGSVDDIPGILATGGVEAVGGNGVVGLTNQSNGAGTVGIGPLVGTGGAGILGDKGGTGGLAGLFNGNVDVIGELSKSSGSFKIDHPLDPENQYLYHSFVESPDMMNIYNGNVTLDAFGEAWIDLPPWFEALNRSFRYQLTPIGGPGPDLHVAVEIDSNRFQIAGGPPKMRVSWQVTGVRHDPWARHHRVPVEQDKPARERGTYLFPVGYDMPEEMGLIHRIRNQVAEDIP